MAFNPANLTKADESYDRTAFGLYYNAGSDTLADVELVGYFPNNYPGLRADDFLKVTAFDGIQRYRVGLGATIQLV